MYTKEKHTQFIVSVAEVPAQVPCIICRGGSKHPAISPRPPVGILDFRIPLLSLNSEAGGKEVRTIYWHQFCCWVRASKILDESIHDEGNCDWIRPLEETSYLFSEDCSNLPLMGQGIITYHNDPGILRYSNAIIWKTNTWNSELEIQKFYKVKCTATGKKRLY